MPFSATALLCSLFFSMQCECVFAQRKHFSGLQSEDGEARQVDGVFLKGGSEVAVSLLKESRAFFSPPGRLRFHVCVCFFFCQGGPLMRQPLLASLSPYIYHHIFIVVFILLFPSQITVPCHRNLPSSAKLSSAFFRQCTRCEGFTHVPLVVVCLFVFALCDRVC